MKQYNNLTTICLSYVKRKQHIKDMNELLEDNEFYNYFQNWEPSVDISNLKSTIKSDKVLLKELNNKVFNKK